MFPALGPALLRPGASPSWHPSVALPSLSAPARPPQLGSCLSYAPDQVGERGVPSASLTLQLKQGKIDEVDKGKRGVGSLFTGEQERLVAEPSGRLIDFKALSILGPVESRK